MINLIRDRTTFILRSLPIGHRDPDLG